MNDRAVAMKPLYDEVGAAHREGGWRELERRALKLIEACEPTVDVRYLAEGHYYLGVSHYLRNDARNARASYQTALELFTAQQDRAGLLKVKVGLAAIAGDLDFEPVTFRRLCEEALLMARELGDDQSVGVTLGNLADACRLEGDYAPALRYAEEAAAALMRLQRWSLAGGQYATAAHVHVLRRELPAALESMRLAWEYLQREPNVNHRAWYFEVWFLIAASLERWETAARLYGFARHYRDVNNAQRLQGMLPWLSGPVERLYERLGHERAEELFIEGEALSIEQAQELATHSTL
jgi:tetratricopeptide (TPR) repeat protein